MPAPIDLTGHIYGRLTVLHETVPPQYPRKWHCICKCGTEKIIIGGSLRNGSTKSCGCLNREINSAREYIHGEYGTRLYNIWHGMKQRCENINSTAYSFYGALGIVVCSDWQEFINFSNWANTTGYNDILSIDRIDSSLGYNPNNCRWVDATIQARNQKKRHTNTSGYVGVSFVSRLNKYQAYITIAYKKINLGYFANAIDAYHARETYIQQHSLEGFPFNE